MIKDWSTSGNMTKEDRIWYTIFSGIFQYILPLGKELCKPLPVLKFRGNMSFSFLTADEPF